MKVNCIIKKYLSKRISIFIFQKDIVVKKDIIVTIISNRGTSSDRRTTDEIENGDAAQPNKCTFSINSYVHYFLPPPPGPLMYIIFFLPLLVPLLVLLPFLLLVLQHHRWRQEQVYKLSEHQTRDCLLLGRAQ